MQRKILIVGGVAGGASAAARLRRNSEEDQIIMFEKGPHVSFSNCSLPYHLSGVVKSEEDLILMSPDIFKKQYNIEARINSEVLSIDRPKKEVVVKNVLTNELYRESYDKLILSPGAFPIVPEIPGAEHVPTFSIRNVVDIHNLKKGLEALESKEVTVIGGGYIGIEVAENLREAGYEVTLVESYKQILKPFDYDMVQIFHKVLVDHGINLIVNDRIVHFDGNEAVLESGKRLKVSAMVMAIGVLPETKLAKEAGLGIGATGGIKVDKNNQTSDPDIYAVGDAIEVYHQQLQTKFRLSLAGPALKQARSVADHIHGKETLNKGYIGSSAIKVFEYNGAATGLSEGLIEAYQLNVSYQTVHIIPSDKVGLMPDSAPMHFKLLFEVPTGKILGAQAIGKGDVTKRIDVIATAIKFGGNIQDLKDLEFSYAPPYTTAKDVVNYAGYVGSNLLNGVYKQVTVDKVRELVENNSMIIDVREEYEYKRGHIKNAINIPLSQLRDRMDEIPKDQPVYLHCRTGQRSYNATRALQNVGYDKVFNIAGSFLGLSFYEYYNDVTTGRDKILTEYNFR